MFEALRDTVAGQVRTCKSTNPAEVVVCGHSHQKYRIDPSVLAAERAVEALPPKGPITVESSQTACVGPKCGTDSFGVVPIIGIALVAARAAELAAQGNDWREAFRTHPDTYQAYQDAKTKDANQPHISIGLSAGNK